MIFIYNAILEQARWQPGAHVQGTTLVTAVPLQIFFCALLSIISGAGTATTRYCAVLIVTNNETGGIKNISQHLAMP